MRPTSPMTGAFDALRVGIVFAMLLAGAIAYMVRPRPFVAHEATPAKHQVEGYVGATACKSCHPGEYASWKRSFHSTMTRTTRDLLSEPGRKPAFPKTLRLHDRDFQLFTQEERLYVQGPDLHDVAEGLFAASRGARARIATAGGAAAKEAFQAAERSTREVVLVTGSHHYLAFWVEGGAERELRQLPFVYLLGENRWLPRREAFLQPPDALPHIARWNANCIQCHSVAGRPRQSQGRDTAGGFWQRYDTDAADLGIACEACHGPGGKHASRFRDPLERHRARKNENNKTSNTRRAWDIVVPGQDDENRGSQICGQCHSYFLPSDPDVWWSNGFSTNYRAGADLRESRQLLRAPTRISQAYPQNRPEADPLAPALSIDPASLFWDGGGIMVGGREYNALLASGCNVRGRGKRKLSCTSCHSMHGGAPDHQIKPEFVASASRPQAPDQMCTQCHDAIDANHSGHSLDSPGARCTACHMPATSYALLSGVASHLLDSPAPIIERAKGTGPQTAPQACALCHVDRSARWLNESLWSLFELGTPPDSETVKASQTPVFPWAIQRAMQGNAAERALFAHSFGLVEPSDQARLRWVIPALRQLTQDPYRAIRHMATRGLARTLEHAPSRLAVDQEDLARLHAKRDRTPMTISE